ncbi:hypothetical protein [Commensalibacter communis]|uniref:Uncharacterized protein n=1 Tax=Commensalibacter communis TaxID=2972786 RepID=A0A9W4TS62_9PROT|nr:hypothetical protein [Commensalibacter communis]CAI3933915.1 unnamed protein product [Commensalibacter communis]CAI3942237.1 unnamed protein product [Commensalibacter communis]CAI3944295.1 unnamed protein product [Commensalibacter communis]CAI3944422.1 unnamed protein product [Commensalibacter communis]CAI3960399.1 unnamed protein product [Commensalibacter communis]
MKYEQQIFNPQAWSQEDLQKKKKLEDEIIMFDRLTGQRFAFDALNHNYHYYRQRSIDARTELNSLIESNNNLIIPVEKFHGRQANAL